MNDKSTPFRISLALIAILVLIAVLQYGSSRYGWTLSSAQTLYLGETPTYELLGSNPVFPDECGEDTMNASGGAYGEILDLEFHIAKSSAIVEGTARVSGPARYSGVEYRSRSRSDEAAGINTPFIITVTETHKGPEQDVWEVSESGDLVGCDNYQRSADQVRLFDGAEGLFLISTAPEFVGDMARLAIVVNSPDWHLFSEENFGSIEDAVTVIRSLE